MYKFTAISVLIILALSLPSVTVQANTPTVLSITRRMEGSNSIIDVKVSHTGSSDSHYIPSILLDLDGTQKTFMDLTKSTTSEVTYSLNIGSMNPKTIKAQAICNLHGPSSVFSENSTPGTTGGIPSYPLETIIIGSVMAIGALIAINTKR